MNDAVSVVGLGKLGLGLSLTLASAGLRVVGVDIDPHVVQSIGQGQSPIVEPHYQELIEIAGDRFVVTHSHAEAIAATDVTFILVPTPSTGDGRFSNHHVESALKSLAEALATNTKPYHLFVISSTVVPGSTSNSFIPILERHSGRTLNEGLGVCYDPDFVALGSVIRDFRNPDLILIGESDTHAGNRLARIHDAVSGSRPVVARMSLISAEVAKVALNAYITMKISFANTLANLCEAIPGSDVDAITAAIGVDRRISPHYLRGGPAYGGTCFPRDTRAFVAIAEQHGVEAELIRATEQVNARQHAHLAKAVLAHLAADRRVSILGVAFKAGTPVVEASPAMSLIPTLVSAGVAVTVYDPLALEGARAVFADAIAYAANADECLASAPVCVMPLWAKEYRLAVERFVPAGPLTIIDCWRTLDPSALHERVTCIGLGRAPQE